MASFFRRAAILAALAAPPIAGVGGCGKLAETPAMAVPEKAPPTAKPADDHPHKDPARGGILIPVGGDKYHVEAVFEKDGTLRLFTLGKDESNVVEVEAQLLKGFAKLEGVKESEAVVFAPEPQAGDREGMTSQFVARLPAALVGKKIVVSVPAIRIGVERLRFAFISPTDGGDHGMPAKVADEFEKALYLTPGGKYTAADIAANGNVTASQKFKGLKAEHDLKPKPGDKICPVTLTKANAKFTWVVGGQPYEFCCPPCVDEFVAQSKEKPETVRPPTEFRQK